MVGHFKRLFSRKHCDSAKNTSSDQSPSHNDDGQITIDSHSNSETSGVQTKSAVLESTKAIKPGPLRGDSTNGSMENKSENRKPPQIDTAALAALTAPYNESSALSSMELNTTTPQNEDDQRLQRRNTSIMAPPGEPPHERHLLSSSPDEDDELTSEALQLLVCEQEYESTSKVDKGKGAAQDPARSNHIGMDGSSGDQHQEYTTVSEVNKGSGLASVSAMPDHSDVKSSSYTKNPPYGSDYGSSVAETEIDIEPTTPRVALRRDRSRSTSPELEPFPPARELNLDYVDVPCEDPCQHDPGTCTNLQNQGPEFQQDELNFPPPPRTPSSMQNKPLFCCTKLKKNERRSSAVLSPESAAATIALFVAHLGAGRVYHDEYVGQFKPDALRDIDAVIKVNPVFNSQEYSTHIYIYMPGSNNFARILKPLCVWPFNPDGVGASYTYCCESPEPQHVRHRSYRIGYIERTCSVRMNRNTFGDGEIDCQMGHVTRIGRMDEKSSHRKVGGM